MPKNEPSPGAMKLARAIFDDLYGDNYWKDSPDAAELIVLDIAAIIARHTEQTWIPYSAQMPTKEDGNAQGNVLYGYPAEGELMTAPWNLWSTAEELEKDFDHTYTHWTHHPNDPNAL